MTWTCAAFEGWLDDGRPDWNELPAQLHAGSCGHCTSALQAALSVELALALPSVAIAPAGFTDAVMRRLTSQDLPLRATPAAQPPRWAWWALAAADPMIVSLCALAPVLAWHSSALWTLAGGLVPRLSAWVTLTAREWAAWADAVEAPVALRAFADPAALLALSVTAAALLLWVSWHLARRLEQAVSRPVSWSLRAR